MPTNFCREILHKVMDLVRQYMRKEIERKISFKERKHFSIANQFEKKK